ncbi:hypothetical protein [Methylocystis bryophila]|uniref:Uncharacterized protein n=1 Tax=Methylocystis bryophila TaxID=655015 RepID=A0A1W6N196_9HYPH|nr:hypothetical protein [Methylocystis bryophila]ARN83603.1 hypothetical protein B1812_12090 [Methylocystis bryophila]
MDNEMAFRGTFDVNSLPGMRPGGWYIGFACRNCRRHFAIMDDPTGSGQIRFAGDAAFRAACPNCEASHDFRVAELVLFEAAQGGPVSTA